MDHRILRFMNTLAADYPLVRWAVVFGARYLIVLLALSSIVLAFRRRALLLLVLAAGLSLFINYLIASFIFFRPRPEEGVLRLIGQPWTAKSFPSDHAALSLVFALVVFFYYPKSGLLLAFLALVVGLSRVAAGVHYPLDIIAGFAVGTVASFIAKSLVRL